MISEELKNKIYPYLIEDFHFEDGVNPEDYFNECYEYNSGGELVICLVQPDFHIVLMYSKTTGEYIGINDYNHVKQYGELL